MSSNYPEKVEAHVRELRREFGDALASTKANRVRTEGPVPEHVSKLIGNGMRKGIAEGLSQRKCYPFPSKQAKKDTEEMILSHIQNELHGQLQDSLPPDTIPRSMLTSLYASFMDLSHKYTSSIADLNANTNCAGANGQSILVSPVEAVLKIEEDSSSPLVWQEERDELDPTGDDHNTNQIKYSVTLPNNLVDRRMNDEEWTGLVNESISSDPAIPSHLSSSKWITGAKLLNSGDIEVHVETEDDRDFLILNTHWRPELERRLSQWGQSYGDEMEAVHPERAAGQTLFSGCTDEFEAQQSEQDRVENTVAFPRLEQGSPGIDRGSLSHGHSHTSRTFPHGNQRDAHRTMETQRSYLPIQANNELEAGAVSPYTVSYQPYHFSYATPAIGRPTTPTEPREHKRRRALIFDTHSGSDDASKRMKHYTMDQQQARIAILQRREEQEQVDAQLQSS